jgi:hypothetical protein
MKFVLPLPSNRAKQSVRDRAPWHQQLWEEKT